MDDQKFQHIWEFRTRDETSSDDDDTRSMSSGDRTTDTNLLKNCNEANCYPHPPQSHCVMSGRCNSTDSQAVQVNEKNDKPVKKKKKILVQKKPTRVKGTRKTKRKVEADMLKDLKMHADSLVHELAVARVDMVARMGEEMKKVLVGSGEARAKYVRRVPDKKGDISLKQTESNRFAMVPSTSENRLGDRRINNCMDLNDPIPNNSISHGFAGIQAEGFGRFSGIRNGHLGFRSGCIGARGRLFGHV